VYSCMSPSPCSPPLAAPRDSCARRGGSTKGRRAAGRPRHTQRPAPDWRQQRERERERGVGLGERKEVEDVATDWEQAQAAVVGELAGVDVAVEGPPCPPWPCPFPRRLACRSQTRPTCPCLQRVRIGRWLQAVPRLWRRANSAFGRGGRALRRALIFSVEGWRCVDGSRGKWTEVGQTGNRHRGGWARSEEEGCRRWVSR
jgi:hypothetical protein